MKSRRTKLNQEIQTKLLGTITTLKRTWSRRRENSQVIVEHADLEAQLIPEVTEIHSLPPELGIFTLSQRYQ
jgi:hypothetical protein